MHVFGGAGLVMGVIGFLIALYLGISRLFFDTGLTERPLFLVAFFLMVLGIQFVAIGILADILLKIYYGQNGRKNYLTEAVIK